MRAYYDLHLHSCLSPCGDNDMTPNNIVGMAKLLGLNIVALTDHNSCKNCPAAVEAGKKQGLCVVPGMELCTAEEIHMVCLFPDLLCALRFDREIACHIMPVKNRPDIYGEQLILDENDGITGTMETLLITAADIPLSGLSALVDRFGGICFPAHIDRDSYSVLSVLGEIPPEESYSAVEITAQGDVEALKKRHPILNGKILLKDSDAHYLENMEQACAWIDLPELSAAALVQALKAGTEKWSR